LGQKTLTYGLQNGADLTAKKFQLSFGGLNFAAQTPSGKSRCNRRWWAGFNVYNILAAVGRGSRWFFFQRDHRSRHTQSGSGRGPVPSAFDLGQPFFGCGGLRAHRRRAGESDPHRARTQSKAASSRSLAAAARATAPSAPSWRTLGTAERPFDSHQRQSAPGRFSLKIISDVVVGMQKSGGEYMIEPDRARPFALAIDKPQSAISVLLRERVHEDYQVLPPHHSF